MEKSVFIISAVVLLLLFLLGAVVYNSEKLDKSAKVAAQNQAFLAREYAPGLGLAEAKVQPGMHRAPPPTPRRKTPLTR